MLPPELGGGHEAVRVHHVSRRRCGGVPARPARTTAGKPVKKRALRTVKSKRRNTPVAVRRRGSFAGGRETKVARLTRELNEALQQQSATIDASKCDQPPANREAPFDEQTQQFREILESCPAALVVVDEDGRLLFHNARLRELFGYTKEEMELLDTRAFWHDLG